MGIGKSGSSKTLIKHGRFAGFLRSKASLFGITQTHSAAQLTHKSLIKRGALAPVNNIRSDYNSNGAPQN